MSKPDTFNYYVVAAPGTAVSTGAASAAVVIPNAANGQPAKYVRVAVATGAAYVAIGPSGVAATAAGILVTAGESVVLFVGGMTHIAHIQEAATAKMVITPLEVG